MNAGAQRELAVLEMQIALRFFSAPCPVATTSIHNRARNCFPSTTVKWKCIRKSERYERKDP